MCCDTSITRLPTSVRNRARAGRLRTWLSPCVFCNGRIERLQSLEAVAAVGLRLHKTAGAQSHGPPQTGVGKQGSKCLLKRPAVSRRNQKAVLGLPHDLRDAIALA